jgi:hypothetical protein
MPNRSFHQPQGALWGTVAALAVASGQPPRSRLIEAVGGSIAGYGLSMVPDGFEPATSPHHRGFAHAVAPNVLAVGVIIDKLPEWQNWLRTKAEEHSYAAETATTPALQLWNVFLEFCLRLAAGALAGAVGGHCSHLWFDSKTTFGIPVFCTGY